MDSQAAPQIIEFKPSDGMPAEVGQTVVVHYVCALSLEALEAGELIESSWDKDPITFPLGVGEALKGIDKGLVGMGVGSTRRLILPPELAYGEIGVPGRIPPDCTLFFEVYLLAVESLSSEKSRSELPSFSR
jgi:FKBP-type peptidyl-prolyl cis-trans isomerase